MGKDVSDQIRILLDIQKLDLEIRDIKEKEEEIPRYIKEGEEKVKHAEEEVNRLHKEIERTLVKRKEKELELESNQETIRKYQLQLYQVKTNKEYASLLHEIEDLKRKNSLLEDEIIELMEKAESGEELMKNEKDNLIRLKEELEKRKEEGRKKLEILRKREKELKEKKNNLAREIDAMLLSRYERLIQNRGTALAEIRDETCGGCHLELPPQVLNEVKGGKKLVTCERCSRILYWTETEEEGEK